MIAVHLKTQLEALHLESFAWALHCCYKDRLAAEEVLQLSYLKVLEGKAIFKEKAQFKTWLFSIIRYTAIDYYKKEKRLQVVINATPTSPIRTDNQAQEIIFQQALNQLSPKQSRILHLVFYQDLTIQEAAEIMEMPIGTARTHYKRGKVQLKKWLTTAGFAVNGKFVMP